MSKSSHSSDLAYQISSEQEHRSQLQTDSVAERELSRDHEDVTSFNRFVDLRLRSVAAQSSASDMPVTDRVRQQLKYILRLVGRDGSLLPHIVADGEGGCFAEWLVAGNKLEVGIDGDGDAYVLAVTSTGRAILNDDFDPSDPPAKVMGTTRHLLRTLRRFIPDSPTSSRAANT